MTKQQYFSIGRIHVFVASMIVSSVLSWGAQAHPPESETLTRQSDARVIRVISALEPILRYYHASARVSYLGTCSAIDKSVIIFPKLYLSRETVSVNVTGAARQLFKFDRKVVIRQISADLIDVEIDKAPSNILNTEINDVQFEPIERYNGQLAVDKMENTAEVKLAEKALGMYALSKSYEEEVFAPPDEHLPRLPAIMEHVSLDQALDTVARTFGGIIFFGVCPHEHLFQIDFAG